MAHETQGNERALSNIVKGVDRASHLVNQLLTLSRLDESAMAADRIVDLGDALRTVLNDLRASADEKAIAVVFQANTGDKFPILGNTEAIYILFRNLVDNAIRYGPTDSAVSLTLTQQQNNWLITITDEGSGIPVGDQDKVFDRFHRRTKADTYGTGLGLSIVKGVVNLHRGKISIQQRDDHSGLCVQVLLPVCRRETLPKETSDLAILYSDEGPVTTSLVAEH